MRTNGTFSQTNLSFSVDIRQAVMSHATLEI